MRWNKYRCADFIVVIHTVCSTHYTLQCNECTVVYLYIFTVPGTQYLSSTPVLHDPGGSGVLALMVIKLYRKFEEHGLHIEPL
jgi:hypothetical protein